MGNSDSDSENECFESAEESLDEEETVENIETKSKKSENEVAKPVYNNVDYTPQLEKDAFSNSTSYRKRPDRVKRSISNTPMKPISKLPSTDAIFKADKIVPDAFFQDITSNLSKNINKSLSTLQQKSSNVKDMILSSLPVSSANDDKGFSYDDNTLQTLPDVSEILNAESEFQSTNQLDELIGHDIEDSSGQKEWNYGEVKLITGVNSLVVDNLSNSNKDREPLDITHNFQEKSSDGNTLVDDFGTESTNLTVKEELDALDSCVEKPDEDKAKENIETVSKKINDPEVSDKAFSNSNCIEILQEEGAMCCDIKKTESLNFLYDTNEICEKSETTPNELIKNEMESGVKRNCNLNKFLESTEPTQLAFDESTLITTKPSEQNTENNENLVKNNKNYICNLPEEKVENHKKCNLEELKTALENIVQGKKNISGESKEILEKDSAKENLILQKENVNQSSNDGWDDFDFSDEEVEDNTINKTDNSGAEFKQAIAGSNNNKPTESHEKISFAGERGGSKPETRAGKKTAKKEDSCEKEKIKEISGKPELGVSQEPEPDDGWDWDDNWDEIPEDNKENTKITESNNAKTKDNSSDLSKWTGWDTFAQKPQEKQGNWGLGSWGMDMLLNKATAVTQGISNVLEAGLGAPDPETLARMEKLEREKLKELEADENQEYPGEISKKNSLTNVNLFPVSGITSLVAGVTSKIVEHSKIQEIGSKVITGGLDTLETFGKKTMEVLQEGDPGLKNKRALLMGNNKPILSQVLREAREKADREMKKAEEKEMAKKCHFETLFDDFQGMVHLEALEMLSTQCELKLEQIKGGMNSEEQEDLNGILEEVEQLCALDECEVDLKPSVLDFKTALQMAVEPLKNEISVHKIIQIHENVNKWLEMFPETECSAIVVNQKLVSTLAELAAATVQQFHKSGELLSVKECRKTVEEVDALSRLTNILCTEINRLCEKFILLSHSKGLTGGSNNSLNSVTGNVTVVMKNSISYIRQAFNLLIPVLQLGAAV